MPEANTSIVILLKFTTTDGQEIPAPDYAAVPSERLRKLEEIAIIARKLMAENKAHAIQGAADIAQRTLSDLTPELYALEKIWNFKASNLPQVADRAISVAGVTDNDEARIEAGH